MLINTCKSSILMCVSGISLHRFIRLSVVFLVSDWIRVKTFLNLKHLVKTLHVLGFLISFTLLLNDWCIMCLIQFLIWLIISFQSIFVEYDFFCYFVMTQCLSANYYNLIWEGRCTSSHLPYMNRTGQVTEEVFRVFRVLGSIKYLRRHLVLFSIKTCQLSNLSFYWYYFVLVFIMCIQFCIIVHADQMYSFNNCIHWHYIYEPTAFPAAAAMYIGCLFIPPLTSLFGLCIIIFSV